MSYLKGQTTFKPSDFNHSSAQQLQSFDTATTEDCFFLDILVSKKTLDNANRGKGSAVLVWIYGGGYTQGYKSQDGSPAGLIKRSEANGNEGIIVRVLSVADEPLEADGSEQFVSFNYRLGAFGWLSGPSFQVGSGPILNAAYTSTEPSFSNKADGISNAGLHDQR